MTEAIAPLQIVLTRHFAARPERVFEAWLTPRTLGMWMFGHVAGERVLGLDLDPRVGGRFSLRVDRGGVLVNHVGQYLTIDRPSLLAFSWGVQGHGEDALSEVRLAFSDDGDGCHLALTHRIDPRWAAYLERTRHGWATMLDALADLFPGSQPR
jgi:uncharacterized protein YndB with AHSA1/START domain